VGNLQAVQVPEAGGGVRKELRCTRLWNALWVFLQIGKKLPCICILQEAVDAGRILKVVVQFDHICVSNSELREDLAPQLLLQASLDNPLLLHDLHGKVLSCLFIHHTPYLSERASTKVSIRPKL
jgi:hypothetical protein